MWIERTDGTRYPYIIHDSWGGRVYIASLKELKKEIKKIEKENKEKGLTK